MTFTTTDDAARILELAEHGANQAMTSIGLVADLEPRHRIAILVVASAIMACKAQAIAAVTPNTARLWNDTIREYGPEINAAINADWKEIHNDR